MAKNKNKNKNWSKNSLGSTGVEDKAQSDSIQGARKLGYLYLTSHWVSP